MRYMDWDISSNAERMVALLLALTILITIVV